MVRAMHVTIWHNPGCSKSRQALALLNDRGLEPTVRRYLKDSPTEAEIRTVLKQLGAKSPHDLVRKRDKMYKALSVGEMDGEQAIVAMAENSSLIERPVVIAGDAARIGRPTDAILEIL